MTEKVPPLPSGATVVGDADGEQAAPAWFPVTVLPAITTVPLRVETLGLAATVNEAVPLPVPVAPVAMVMNELRLVDVHWQFPVAPLMVSENV